jgi:penicillin-binding protein 1C
MRVGTTMIKQDLTTIIRWCKHQRIIALFILTLFCSLFFLFMLDRVYPLNLPEKNSLFARVVVDENNRPLRSFADEKGIWRYPVELSQVSPLYIDALINYEDRWFWHHPGINLGRRN